MSSIHEREVISHLLHYPENINIIAASVTPQHFLDRDCRLTLEYMLDSAETELVTISRELKGKADVPSILSVEPPLKSSLPSYCTTIMEDYKTSLVDEQLRAELVEVKEQRSTKGTADRLEGLIDQLRENSTAKKTALDFDSNTVFSEFLVDIEKPKRDDLIPFYLPTINRWLGDGIAPGSLVMLSGNAKDGKSTIALRQTWYLSSRIHRPAFISLEQMTRELVETIVGQMAKVSGTEIRNRQWYENNKDRCKQAATLLKKWGMYLLGSDISSPDNLFSIMRILAENGVKWFTIDHLQLVAEGGGDVGYTYKIKEITRSLKLFAGRYGVVIFLIAQNQTDSEKPKTWGSNVPEQDVDAWLVYCRGDKDDPTDSDFIKLHRNRLPGGKVGDVNTIWNRISNRTEELIEV